MIFPKSTNDIGDIKIKDGNNDPIEQIPVRLLKRKMDLNQSQVVIKRPPRVKKTQKITAQTETPNSEENQQQQDQIMHIYPEQQTGLSTEQPQQNLYIPASQYHEMRPMRSMTAGFVGFQ
ncbi:unnamed protein product, partial [Rotaria sp. Silwood2]